MQAPCPVDYQDNAAEGGPVTPSPSGTPAPAVTVAANGLVSGAKGDGAAMGAAMGAACRSEGAEEAQSWRRQQLAARPNGQVRLLWPVLDRPAT